MKKLIANTLVSVSVERSRRGGMWGRRGAAGGRGFRPAPWPAPLLDHWAVAFTNATFIPISPLGTWKARASLRLWSHGRPWDLAWRGVAPLPFLPPPPPAPVTPHLPTHARAHVHYSARNSAENRNPSLSEIKLAGNRGSRDGREGRRAKRQGDGSGVRVEDVGWGAGFSLFLGKTLVLRTFLSPLA